MSFKPTNFEVGGVDDKDKFLPEVNLAVKDLPSGSLPYPEGFEVKYRPYSYGEVKKISQSSLSMNSVYQMLLDGIECTKIDKYDLTLPDVLFIGVLRKLSTIGTTDVYVPYKCPKCGNTGKHTIKSDSLEFNDLQVPDLPICVDLEKGYFEFMPLTVRTFLDVYSEEKHQDEVYTLAKCCTKSEPSLDFEQIYKTLFYCSANDSRILAKVDSYMDHGLKPIEITCDSKTSGDNKAKSCGHKMRVELDGGQAIILPFRRDKESTGSSIHFGKKSKR